jgi:hypothetical protein
MKGVEYFSRSDGSHVCDYCAEGGYFDQLKAVIVRKEIVEEVGRSQRIEATFLCRDHARKHFPQSIRLLGERVFEIQRRIFPLFDWLVCPLCKLQFSDNSARTEHMLREHSDFFERELSENQIARGDN